ncbi:aconitase X catalytic domain-containing protein [Neobacillus niacini]|uniref:aconitase X catalytic domain-containing protein n=1 Tax=Neobacillus niacini TaxID=86668 RepID=UPI002855CF31|nr:aconitase X catalytic domain-containing protein [Neobacillus niacini]MDR7001186.1 putative aconitase [Neobacillus niacini]
MQVELTKQDRSILIGNEGKAIQLAMRVIVRMAEIQGAKKLIDIECAHIDGCIYTGPASLHFAETLAELGGRVTVPTTMNAISIDRKRWKDQGVEAEWANSAQRLADAYLRMGAKPTFTCAPYLLPEKPQKGMDIAWAESNAVVYANSVLGAKTNRYGDLMDICAAITGRVPLTGLHLEENRKGTILIDVGDVQEIDSFFYPVFGYLVGQKVNGGVPVIVGLNHSPSADDLKAFGAACATAGSVGMFHIVGITPEAPTVEKALGNKPPASIHKVSKAELQEVWEKLSSGAEAKVDMITLGSPHFSYEECEHLAEIIEREAEQAQTLSEKTSPLKVQSEFIITTSQYVYEKALTNGIATRIENFGIKFLTDTCLCMINTPVIPDYCQTLMTNSAKYAHYAPGLVNRKIYFSSLKDCVRSAIAGRPIISRPKWLY